jgi:hypothetical protein
MGFGIRLRELSLVRRWVIGCAALALAAAAFSLVRTSGSLKMATATTEVVVDTPKSMLVDITQDTHAIDALTNRALLLGNVMGSPEVRADIARRAKVPFAELQVLPPLTPKQPRVLAESGNEKRATDILKLNDEYRLYIRANPTVPFLTIYAQTPTRETAEALANAAVGGMQSYLDGLAASTDTQVTKRVRLVQLGEAKGEVINGGIEWDFALLVFLVTFAVACATVIWIRRVREGWQLAALSGQKAT